MQLFALYHAELGGRSSTSGPGIKVGGVAIPGLFFAEDKVVMEQGEGDLGKLLRMVGECGREWKMKFNLSESRVVNIEKKSNKDILGDRKHEGSQLSRVTSGMGDRGACRRYTLGS